MGYLAIAGLELATSTFFVLYYIFDDSRGVGEHKRTQSP